MKRLLTLAIVVLATALLPLSAGLIPDMKFRRLDTSDGLTNSQVNCVLRDSRGFIWIGTPYGLNRYDGYRLRTFYSNVRDTTTMRDNYIEEIYEGHDGLLWLKHGMNYCVYDPVSERFRRDVSSVLGQYGIKGSIEWMYIDKDKKIWAKPYDDGIYCYNPSTRHLAKVPLGYGQGAFSPDYSIASRDNLGKLLVLTTHTGEMVCLDGEAGKVVWVNKWMKENGGYQNQQYFLRIDDEGNYWVVNTYNSFVYIKSEDRWYASLPQYLKAHGIDNVPDEMMVWGSIKDQHGRLWVVTDHLGLFVVDLKDKQVRQFLNSKYDETSISDNTFRCIYLDPTGPVWLGTYKNGVNQYVESTSHFQSLELGDITTACEDRYGNYWLGTNDQGILAYDPKTGEKVQYTTANSALSSNIVVGSCAAADGSLWFGSYNGGLTHCIPQKQGDRKVAQVVNYRVESGCGLSSNNVWSITEDRWHRIWISTLGGGVQMLDPATMTFRTWNTKNTSISGDYLSSLAWMKKGWLMVGTNDYYTIVNPVSGELINGAIPESPSITVNFASTSSVMEDSRGLIWQGSSSGACVYDPKTGFVTLLDMSKGLIGSSVCSFAEDKQHIMWVVTDHGVSKVIPEKRDNGTWQFTVSSYTSRDGLQKSTYNQRSMYVTRSGLLLIGGQGGLDIIDPTLITAKKDTEKPIFSGLQIYDHDVDVGREYEGHIVLDEALWSCGKLKLRYRENNFTVHLGSNAGVINNRKRFIYKLDGFRDSWTKTAEANPVITLMSLPTGNYTLLVRMVNDDGTIGSEECALDIAILAPWYRSWWAIAAYLIAAAAALWLYRRRDLLRGAAFSKSTKRQ